MGRFLLGFAVGAAIGAAAVILASPRPGGKTQSIQELLNDAFDVGRRASNRKQQELWSDYHKRIEDTQQEKPQTPPWTPYES